MNIQTCVFHLEHWRLWVNIVCFIEFVIPPGRKGKCYCRAHDMQIAKVPIGTKHGRRNSRTDPGLTGDFARSQTKLASTSLRRMSRSARGAALSSMSNTQPDPRSSHALYCSSLKPNHPTTSKHPLNPSPHPLKPHKCTTLALKMIAQRRKTHKFPPTTGIRTEVKFLRMRRRIEM